MEPDEAVDALRELELPERGGVAGAGGCPPGPPSGYSSCGPSPATAVAAR
jgi:hypothetical protein